MTNFDDGVGRLRSAASHLLAAANTAASAAGSIASPIAGPWGRFNVWLKTLLPKGLYARALLIIIVPMVVLQSVVAFMFVERQMTVVNYYLSSAVTRDIATLIDVYRGYPQAADRAQLKRIAQERLGLVVDFLPETQLPPPGPKPFFSQLDAPLSDEIRKQIGLPFWIDTVGRSSIVEIRIKLDDSTIMRVFARRAAAYDFNSWIFLMFPAQSNPADRAAGRCSRSLRQGSGGDELPAARRSRSSPRRSRFHGNEDPHRACHRATHDHAGRRVA
jgi:two-component system osmolarity sensor histidine kinase EnvZ